MTKKIILSCILLITLMTNAQDKDVFDVARKGTLAEIQAIYKNHPELINSMNEDQFTPLIIACYKGNVDVALFLIEKVSNINYVSGDGTALMAAVMSGKMQIIESLISHKANVNLADAQGKTALIYAAFFNRNDVVKILIRAGVDKKQKDSDGKSALDYANFNKNTELIILLDG